MKKKIKSSFFLMILIGHSNLWAGWHDRKAEGWAWYENRKKIEKKHEHPNELESPASSASQLEQVQKILHEKLATALLEPSVENIRSYMEEQQKWVERSSDFASTWAQVLLKYPQLDYTATHIPVSQYGLQLYKQNLQEEKETLIRSLAKDYGLFFFFHGKSESSKIFGKIVREFSKKYGFEVVAISLDGLEIDGFESSKKDNGIAEALGVELTPTLYLIDPKANIAVPISFGLVAMDKIEENIALQSKDLRGQL